MTLSLIRRDDRGIALPVALFALVVIGTLIAGVFFTARLEMRGGESAMSAIRASEAAQAGLQVGVPNTVTIGAALADGGSVTGTQTQIGTSASYYTYTVTRLNYYLFLVRSLGEYRVNGVTIAKRTMAQLVKRYKPEVIVNAGATVVGTPSVKGSVIVDGNDHVPPGWTGCTAGAAVPGIRTNASDTTQVQKASNIVTATGTPEIVGNDTSVTNMSSVLDTLFYQLAGQANVVLNVADGATISGNPNPAGTGTCVKTDSLNWGDPGRGSPANACENYFPIVYINPAMTSATNHGSVKLHMVGQGVLLINGDMEVNAGSNFTGLILIRGDFGKANGNTTITGGVISQNADLDATGAAMTGNLTLNYSKCAVTTALNNLAVSAPTQYRGFMQF
jgi:hypothetical protein